MSVAGVAVPQAAPLALAHALCFLALYVKRLQRISISTSIFGGPCCSPLRAALGALALSCLGSAVGWLAGAAAAVAAAALQPRAQIAAAASSAVAVFFMGLTATYVR